MADKPFGVEELNLIGASGTPTIESPNNLNIVANLVNISTDLTAVGDITAAYFYGDGSNLSNINAGTGINAAGTAGAIQFKASGGGLGGDVELFGIDVTNQRIGIGTDPTDTNNFVSINSSVVPLIIKAKDSGGGAGSSSNIQFIQGDGEDDFSRFIFANNDLTAAAEILAVHNTVSTTDARNSLYLTVYGSSTESLLFRSSASTKAFYPSSDDTIDLGKSSNQFKDIYFSGTLYQNGTAFSGGGSGTVTDISVTQDENNCGSNTTNLADLITVSGTTSVTINVEDISNAHGRKFISSTEPSANDACDGDLWYKPEDIASTDAIQVVQGAWNGTPYANANPISVSGATVGIGTTSNAHGRRYIESGAPTAGIGTYGDIWYDITGSITDYDFSSLPDLP